MSQIRITSKSVRSFFKALQIYAVDKTSCDFISIFYGRRTVVNNLQIGVNMSLHCNPHP